MKGAAVLRAAAVTVAVVATLVAALAVGGAFALTAAAECLAVVALVIALASTPGGAREPGTTRVAAAWARMTGGRVWPRRKPPAPVRTADFPAYAKISSDLGWSHVSQWHYDHGVRPLLGRLVTLALAERHGVNATADPARARRVVGDEIWPFVDPSRPPSFDSKTPGVGPRALSRLVDRLEQL